MADDTRGKPFESWNDRIDRGTAKVPGGLHDVQGAAVQRQVHRAGFVAGQGHATHVGDPRIVGGNGY